MEQFPAHAEAGLENKVRPMRAARSVVSGEAPEPRSTFLPVMTLEQLQEAHDLLRQHDEASAKFNAQQEALRTWGGPGIDGMPLVTMLAAEQPPAVVVGMTVQLEAQDRARHLGAELQDRLSEQRTLRARLEQFTAQHEQERAEVAASLQALEQLRPLTDQILAASAQLALLLSRQTEQRGRGLAGLWGAVSGQAAALQREIEQARRTEEQLWTTYRLKVTSLGLTQLPKPTELGRLVQERRALAEFVERAEAERQAMEIRLRELDTWLSGAQVRLQENQKRAAATWDEAQRLHHVPDWPIWEILWRRRGEAQVLWRAQAEARELLQEAIHSLKHLWEKWPSSMQEAEALRQMLPQIERAMLDRQAWEIEVKRREEEQAQRTALLTTLLVALQARSAALEAEYRTEQLQRTGLLTALLAALQGRLATLEAEHRTEQAQRTAHKTALWTALQERSAARRAEEQARKERRQARTEQLYLEEEAWRTRAAASTGAVPTPPPEAATPVSPIPPRPHPHTDSAEKSSPKAPTRGPYPVLEREHLETARRLLARHTASAGQAAMCLEALEDWTGPGLDSLRLALLVSQPLPAALEQALADWEAVQGHVAGNLAGPEQDEHERRVLDWETAWTDLHRTLGVPAHPQSWGRLWTGRAKAQSLWSQWQQAQERIRQLAAEMAPLWAGWPSTQQNVETLRRALEAAESGTTPGALPTSTTQPGDHTALRPAPVASPVLPPPLPGVGNAPAHRTPTVERPAASAGPRPQLPAQPLPKPPVSGPAPSGSAAGAPVASSPAPISRPSLLPAQAVEARLLLQKYDAAAVQIARHRKALDSWAGNGLDGLRLGELVSRPLPLEITLALLTWKKTESTSLPGRQEQRRIIREAVQDERERAAAKLGPLRVLQTRAQSLIRAEQDVMQASGAALKHAQLKCSFEQNAYNSMVQALRLGTVPAAREVEALIRQEEAEFQRRLRPLEAEWKQLLKTPAEAAGPGSAPPDWKKTWAALSQQYGLPPHPGHWEKALWPERAEGQRLWLQWRAAQQDMERLATELAVLWATWPAEAQSCEVLRRTLDQIENAALQVSPPAMPGERSAAEASGPAQDSQTQAVRPIVVPPLPGRADTSTLPPVPPPVQHERAAELNSRPELTRPLPGPLAQPLPRAGGLNPAPSAVRGTAVSPALSSVTAPTPAIRPGNPPIPPPPVARPKPPLPGSPVGASQPTTLRRIRVPGPALPGQARSPGPAAPEPAVPSGRLTHRQRAEREAIRISEQYNWRASFLLLADTLDRKNWGQLRASIEREIECGMTPQEFELVLQMRAYWHEQIHFQSPHTSRYDSLPWGLGLALIRRSAGVPCVDEMICLIERLYEYADQVCSKRALPAFAQRLGVILSKADPDVDLEYWLCAQEARCFSR